MRTLLLVLLIGVSMNNTNAEPMFQSSSPSVLSIDGSAMKALKIACDEFLASGKDLRDFNVTISEKTDAHEGNAGDIFVVTFMGKLAPGKRGLGTANRAPGSVSYFVSREKWEIVKEQGIK